MAAAIAVLAGVVLAGDDINEVRAALAKELASRPAKARLMAAPRLRSSTASSVTDLGNGYKRYVWDATGSDLTVVKEQGETIVVSFPVDVHLYDIRSVSIDAEAWDVDFPEDTEHDDVYFNGSPIGRLQGGNNSNHVNPFRSLSPSLVKIPATSGEIAQNTFSVKVDVGYEGWVTAINWAKLTVEGREGIKVDATDGTEPEGVKVTWTSVPGATYTLYRGEAKGAKDKRLYGGTDLEFLDEEAEAGKIYFYTVEAVVGSGSGSASGSGPRLLAAGGGTITGDNDGYYEKPPVITGIKFAKLFLTDKGPYNIKLEWNDYKEDVYQVDQIEFTFEGVGAASGKKQSCTWKETSALSKAQLSDETDLSGEKIALKFPNGEHGEYKVKIKWEVTNKDTGKKVMFYYENNEQKPLEFDAPDTAKVYFKKWDNGNWWEFWTRDGAIDKRGFEYSPVLGGNAQTGGGFTGSSSTSYTPPPIPGYDAQGNPLIRNGVRVMYQYPKLLTYTYNSKLEVSDAAPSFCTRLKTGDQSRIGVSCKRAQGVFALGAVMSHELKHKEIHDDLMSGGQLYQLEAGVDIGNYNLDSLKFMIEDPHYNVSQDVIDYYNVLKNMKENPSLLLIEDADRDGVRDSWELRKFCCNIV